MENLQIEGKSTGQPLNLLLVEDDDGDAKAVVRAFRKSRIANPVHRAVDGVEALQMLRGESGQETLTKPYIVIADIKMPRMDGIKFVEEIRADPELRPAIIFMLTTSKSEEDKIRAYDLNVAGYIVKKTAGEDFLKLVDLLGSYWRIVELPHKN